MICLPLLPKSLSPFVHRKRLWHSSDLRYTIRADNNSSPQGPASSTLDRKGKKRASSVSSNPDLSLGSSSSSKKRKSVDGTAARPYSLRSKVEEGTIEDHTASVSKAKGKSKAVDKVKAKTVSRNMPKRSASVKRPRVTKMLTDALQEQVSQEQRPGPER